MPQALNLCGRSVLSQVVSLDQRGDRVGSYVFLLCSSTWSERASGDNKMIRQLSRQWA